ncbi:hypothetical protein GALL_259630 [mine drainage metagenome]|uniref:Uncharacterized protein n=1 Tax=mine drainage metagenome TaxID=410659 RepID=A0A1J5R7Y6_9ZZZZ
MRIIEIPAGSRFIAAWELGRRIGELLHPTPDTPPLLVSLQKKVPEAEPGHFLIEELSDADLLYLRAVWKDIDIPNALNMTREQWALCKTAFHSAPDRPAWELVAGFRDYANEARSEQFRIANKHVQAMNALISSGALRAYDAELAPVQKVDGWGAQLRVEDARAYLAELGIELRESDGRRGALGLIAAMDQSLTQQAVEALAAGYPTSEGPYRRTLPAGKRFFTIPEAAGETASAVYPEQADDRASAKVSGFLYFEATDAGRKVHLTEEEARELEAIWHAASLPPAVFPMEQWTAEAYSLALRNSERGRNWVLCPALRSRLKDASVLWAATRRDHEKLLRQAVAAGQITLLHPATKTPIGAGAAGDAALIRRDDLVKFAASLPEPVELVDPLEMQQTEIAADRAAMPQITPDPTAVSGAGKHLTRNSHHRYRQREQEEEIMRVLSELGFDPTNLPKRQGGAAGPKSAARKRLSYTKSIFDKAWERLRASGAIAGGDG